MKKRVTDYLIVNGRDDIFKNETIKEHIADMYKDPEIISIRPKLLLKGMYEVKFTHIVSDFDPILSEKEEKTRQFAAALKGGIWDEVQGDMK